MTDKNQILWIVTELFPPDETSTAYILGEIANAMTSKYQVKVICGPEIYDKRKKTDRSCLFKLDPSIQLFRSKGLDVDKNTKVGKAIGLLSMSSKLSRMVKCNVKKEDKVLIVTNPLPLIILMSKIKEKIGFELNILVHDIFPENAKPSNINVPFEPIVRKMFDRAYAKADKLIALGRDMEDLLSKKIRKGIKKNVKLPDIKIIENWADINSIFPQEKDGNSRVIIEYAGNIGRGQGLQQFIENLRKANNPILTFDLYGTGASEDALKRYVTKNSVSDVSFHGSYFRSQQNEVLNNCDISLVSLAEGTYGIGVPSKSYNIMAAGKAILYIGDPRSEIALTVKENNIGFCFDSQNNEGLIMFLKNINEDTRHLLKQMGTKARTLAEKKYSKEAILSKFQNTI